MQFGKKKVRRVERKEIGRKIKVGERGRKNSGEKEKEIKKEGNERKEGRQHLNKTLFII